MIHCSQCGKPFDSRTGGNCVASISGSFLGDEYTESLYFCEQCQVYTVEVFRDQFLGEAGVFVRGPVPKPEGEAQVLLIRQCSTPWDKSCRCSFHREYFNGQLD
jgi:hypothetical protein